MSNALITLELSKSWIMQIHDHDDALIDFAIKASSAAIITYLDGYGDVFKDSNGDVDKSLVPFDIQAACALLVAEFFKNREADQDGAVDATFGYGYLPRPVVALLFPYRSSVFS